jgi:hypothetical protein
MSKRMLPGFCAGLLVLGLGACTVEETENTEPGEAPAYEVQPADVELDWDTTRVQVPDVDLEPRDTTAADTLPR